MVCKAPPVFDTRLGLNDIPFPENGLTYMYIRVPTYWVPVYSLQGFGLSCIWISVEAGALAGLKKSFFT